MKNENNKYEFKALTLKSLTIAMICWLFIAFAVLIPIEAFFNYDSIKSPSVFTNAKVFGSMFLISFSILMVVCQFFLSGTYRLNLNENSIDVIKNDKKKYEIPLSEIDSILLKSNFIPPTSTIRIKYKKSDFLIFNGFFFTFHNESHISKNFIDNEFLDYLQNKSFVIKKDKTEDSVTYKYSKS